MDRPAHLLPWEDLIPAGNRNRRIQQIQYPGGRGHGPLVVVEGAAQGGEGPEQALGDEHQEAVGAHGNDPLPSLKTTNHEDGQKGKQDGKANQGNKRCREADGPPVAEPIGLAVLGESAQLPGFGGIALDREHAPEVVA